MYLISKVKSAIGLGFDLRPVCPTIRNSLVYSLHDFYCWERSLNSESGALSASFPSVTDNLEQVI